MGDEHEQIVMTFVGLRASVTANTNRRTILCNDGAAE